MLHSIFPSIANIPNRMPASSGLTSAQMICFFIYWLICIPPLTLSIRQWPILIKIKLVAYFLSCIGMLALALTASDGVGDTLTKKGAAQGSERVWLIVRFTLLATASCATFASNAADWQRNATKTKDPIFGQIFGFPMSNVSSWPQNLGHWN
jgi:NCS1 family nucleobase:cation symporter-1